MNGRTQEACPICERPAQVRRNDLDEEANFDCETCGRFRLSEDALPEFRTICKRLSDPKARALISYCIRQTQRSNKRPFIDDSLLRAFVEHNTLPSPPEQGDNLIRELGKQLEGADPGRLRPFHPEDLKATIGASSRKGVIYVISELRKKGLLNQSPRSDSIGLTFLGWERYSELQQSHSEGPIAFMAMPFNVPQLDHVYVRCFRPAVQQTGFELRRLDEKPPAGLIDVRMEVEIRKSRFLIAELTNGNRGVYWESGFAEGLGKPVIYTCERAYFDEHRSHFDTAHRHTIVWRAGETDQAGEDLKNTIRATLPSEAKMFDDA